jgi:hypothetical protein
VLVLSLDDSDNVLAVEEPVLLFVELVVAFEVPLFVDCVVVCEVPSLVDWVVD